MREINEIIIHCSDTMEGNNYKAADIRTWHMMPKKEGGRGFSDIGYHYVIRLDGTIEVGRPLSKPGAHCLGHNKNSIGICYVGGRRRDPEGRRRYVRDDTRTPDQRKSMEGLVKFLKMTYPEATIHGHREFANKACPCFDVKKWLQSIGL